MKNTFVCSEFLTFLIDIVISHDLGKFRNIKISMFRFSYSDYFMQEIDLLFEIVQFNFSKNFVTDIH